MTHQNSGAKRTTDRVVRIHAPHRESLAAWYESVLGVQWDAAENPLIGSLSGAIDTARFELSAKHLESGHQNVAVHVGDFRETMRRLRAAGARVTEIPTCGHQYAVFEDPDGNRITIWGT